MTCVRFLAQTESIDRDITHHFSLYETMSVDVSRVWSTVFVIGWQSASQEDNHAHPISSYATQTSGGCRIGIVDYLSSLVYVGTAATAPLAATWPDPHA